MIPFSDETASIVSQIQQQLDDTDANGDSKLQDTKVLLTGATPSIMDLRSVTLQDNRRIKFAVVIAVLPSY